MSHLVIRSVGAEGSKVTANAAATSAGTTAATTAATGMLTTKAIMIGCVVAASVIIGASVGATVGRSQEEGKLVGESNVRLRFGMASVDRAYFASADGQASLLSSFVSASMHIANVTPSVKHRTSHSLTMSPAWL